MKSKSFIMNNIQEQVQQRIAQKYNWKRVPHSAFEKFQRKICRMLFSRSKAIGIYNQRSIKTELGTDESGQNVIIGLKQYANMLLHRGIKLHTIILLGSRAKNRAKPESDLDVLVIASDLPGKSSSNFLNIPQKILNIRRYLLLSDFPIFIGVQPAACSKKDFLLWLQEFKVLALDAVHYGKVFYDDGFWKRVLTLASEIERKYELNEMELKHALLSL